MTVLRLDFGPEALEHLRNLYDWLVAEASSIAGKIMLVHFAPNRSDITVFDICSTSAVFRMGAME